MTTDTATATTTTTAEAARPAMDYGGFWIGSRDANPTYVPATPAWEPANCIRQAGGE